MECSTVTRAIETMSRKFGIDGTYLAQKIILQNLRSVHNLALIAIREKYK